MNECNEENCLECSYLFRKLNGNYHCFYKHINMGKNVYYEPTREIGLEKWI